MQKQDDEEALIATLHQEISQIKAEFEQQKKKSKQDIRQIKEELEQQKKAKRPYVILSTISTGIVVPLLVWCIEYFLTNQKWPLVILIPLNRPLLFFLVITTICTYLLIVYVMHRVTHPYMCTCGYSTVFIPRFKKHMLSSHSSARRENES